jgi:hypothetical protein
MKTQILKLIFLIILASNFAQTQFIKGYGFKVGAVSATQTWNYNIDIHRDMENRWGIDAGVYVEFLDLPYISILGELHYIQKGYTEKLPEATPTYPEGTGRYITFKPRVDYFSIPLLTKVRYDMGTVSPYILAGPRFDFLIGNNPQYVGSIFDKFNKNDMGISAGVGIEIPTSAIQAVLLEFKYSPTLSKSYSSNMLTIKNQSFELLFGIKL